MRRVKSGGGTGPRQNWLPDPDSAASMPPVRLGGFQKARLPLAGRSGRFEDPSRDGLPGISGFCLVWMTGDRARET